MTIQAIPKTLFFTVSCLAMIACQAPQAACPDPVGVSLQVLGSGGPIADDARASSGYVVWVNGKSRVLIDAGGGTFLRFGEAGASFSELDFVGLSHLHTDHSADFPALLKSGSFSDRDRPLAIAGPDADGVFPGLKDFLQAMFGKDGGAYAYLSAFLDGTAGKPMLTPREVEVGDVVRVWSGEDLVIDAMRVPHAIVPAVAFRVQTGDKTIVFASDQNGGNPAFVDFAKDASALIMHMVVPENVQGIGRKLHAPPSVIGDIASQAGAGNLVLSHFMSRSLHDLEGNVALVKKRYGGEVVVAEDLACITL